MPPPNDHREGKSSTRGESRATAGPITLDALTKVQDQFFDCLTKGMDLMDNKRFKKHIDSMDQRFGGFIDDLRSDRQSEALHGQQARPEGENISMTNLPQMG